MSRLKNFQEKQKKLTRFQALKSIFSSLFMTTALVIIAVTVIPKSPTGSIQSIDAFTNSITYTVNVTDGDNAIIPGTLQLELVNQFDTLYQEIDLGITSGIFNSLEPDTQYDLKIMADKGFGLEVLDNQKIKTAEKTGGAITGFAIANDDDYVLDYEVNYFISDPFDEYQFVNLRYAFKSPEESEFNTYSVISLSEDANHTLVESVYNNNLEVIIILEAIKYDMSTVKLDEVVFHTPYQIYASFGINQITDDSVNLYVWAEMMDEIDIAYHVTLSQRGFDLSTQNVVIPEYGEMHMEYEEPSIIFDNLHSNMNYTVTLYAVYNDPYTENTVERVLESIDFTTASSFDYDISIDYMLDYYEVTIILDDPEDSYDTAFYNVYTNDYGYYYITETNQYSFEYLNDSKQITFEIFKPTSTEFYIDIGIKNQMNYQIYIILETINTDQEG